MAGIKECFNTLQPLVKSCFPSRPLETRKEVNLSTNVIKETHLCQNHSSDFYSLVIYIFKIFPKIKPHIMLQDRLIILLSAYKLL